MGIVNAIFGEDTPQEKIDEAKDQIRIIMKTLAEREAEGESTIDEWDETDDGFLVKKGSARIFVHFVADDEDAYVVYSSPIVWLPPSNLLAFYRHLLETNSRWGGLLSIGVDGTLVEVELARALEDLTEDEMSLALTNVCGAADELDDELHEKFGAPFWEPGD